MSRRLANSLSQTAPPDSLTETAATAKFYRRCQLFPDLIVGSEYSQRKSFINRQNNYIAYRIEEDDPWKFGYVVYFVSVCGSKKALVSECAKVEINRKERIATLDGFGRQVWIDVGFIKGLLGVLRDSGLRMIITDPDIYVQPKMETLKRRHEYHSMIFNNWGMLLANQ